jgi:amino acid transporter
MNHCLFKSPTQDILSPIPCLLETSMTAPDDYVGPKLASIESFGLRHNALSPLETLAQSISTIAPSTSPQLTIPLVFVLAAQGTAIAYLIAMLLMVLVGLCIASFARESASPGSLYAYTQRSLPPAASVITAWALFFAYITTASAVIGGFVQFAYVFLDPLGLHRFPSVLLVLIAATGAAWVAWRDVKVSARLMLYLEGISVLLIAIVVTILLLKHGVHLDKPQVHVHAMSFRGIGIGVMLAIFSFVGFESATTLGAEAINPLRTIPRAVVQSAILAGIFFVVCAYTEVLGFRTAATALGESANPFRALSTQAGVPWLGPIIDAGVLVSMFAATLACVIAASRVLLLMAHEGLASKRLTATSVQHETPAAAGILAAILAFLPPAALALRGTSGADIYGWMGTLAVYGFLTAYGLVAVALAAHLKRSNRLTPAKLLLTASTALAMLLAMISNVYPNTPPAPLEYFPWIYATYLAAALLWLAFSPTKARNAPARSLKLDS